ncbi:ATP-binding cassette domain-containing protein [Paenibacillus donghaensis]|uniref:Energy-coupling factor ABC transporter ATP-binding protein n=1 Tax=Paenibacillus donghaensis TaxID=414771 RepID=A0A2Z2KP44_9BACL|nr:ATP-binding cassette domain-containing protein [Paenibacillus donghaensis]ASA25443.1 energy-coupling factor ABC transporter ATP-binding protein [Paenibacillus donghaensis]
MNELHTQEDHGQGKAQTVIALNGVSFGYDPTQPILHDISLEIPQGQWVSVVGPNGCGKSTLVKLLNALLPISSGEIEICGLKLMEANIGSIRQIIGMVFQNPDNQFIGATVEEDLLFGLEGMCLPYAEMEQRLQLYSHRLGIASLMSKHPGELSGGQKQRVAIASILAMEPGIVIFDEASSMLDEGSRNDLLAILKGMQAEGKYTILMITHDADEILASDRVLALHGGGLAADLTPAELFQDALLLEKCHLRDPYTWQLARELRSLGIRADVPASEKELIETLWP